MVGRGSSGGGGEEGFTGRAAIGYDHGYDGEVFYLGLALDEKYIEGFVEGCLERIGEPRRAPARMIRMRSYSSVTSGRTRPRGRW
jgi:hypothetical protein